MKIAVFGAGGGGSWIVPKLTFLAKPSEITVWDGDTLEAKNLTRQFYTDSFIGCNKAAALAGLYGVNFKQEYYHSGACEFSSEDILFCCADNHSCRNEVLIACDRYKCRAAIAGNEINEAEAYWYDPAWKDTPNDPRVYYPEILTNRTNDPLAPEGCTGAAQRKNLQLAIANIIAADFALELFWFWTKEAQKLDREDMYAFPVHHKKSMFRFTTVRYCDRLTKEQECTSIQTA